MGTKLALSAKSAALFAAAMSLSGCLSFRPIEPVLEPPVAFQKNATLAVEFVSPSTIGFRCAERGARFLMLPGINSNACADVHLITMPNPCDTVTGGDVADTICKSLQRVNGWRPEREPSALESGLILASVGGAEPKAPSKYNAGTMVPFEFLDPDKVAYRCAERGEKVIGAGGSGMIACANSDLVTMTNPCAPELRGWYAYNFCHEMAHGNGWAADHRGGKLFRRGQGPVADLDHGHDRSHGVGLGLQISTLPVFDDAQLKPVVADLLSIEIAPDAVRRAPAGVVIADAPHSPEDRPVEMPRAVLASNGLRGLTDPAASATRSGDEVLAIATIPSAEAAKPEPNQS